MYEQTSMSVQCNIILDNGYMCGIPNVAGRCLTCLRAFCASHQAYTGNQYNKFMPIVGMCAPCFANAKSSGDVCQFDICDQIPIGRCAICGRAYCNNHGFANDNNSARGFTVLAHLVDKCTSCFELEKRAERAKYEAERAREYALQNYISSGEARTALLASRVQQVKLYVVMTRMKSGLFRDRYVDLVTATGRGWVLGEFEWGYTVNIGYGDWRDVEENCLTVLVDDLVEGSSGSGAPYDIMYRGALVPVVSHSDGYALCDKQGWPPMHHNKYSSFDRFCGDHKAAAQVVKRLVGSSS